MRGVRESNAQWCRRNLPQFAPWPAATHQKTRGDLASDLASHRDAEAFFRALRVQLEAEPRRAASVLPDCPRCSVELRHGRGPCRKHAALSRACKLKQESDEQSARAALACLPALRERLTDATFCVEGTVR